MKKSTVPNKVIKGLKGPINLFPLFFFYDTLDVNWQNSFLDLRRLKHMHMGSYLKNLKKAPLNYLSDQDLKILFFVEAGHTYERIMKAIKEGEEAPIELLFKIEGIANHYQSQHIKRDPSFFSLTQAFISFFHGLMYQGDRSRKLMILADHYMEEALASDEDKEIHPYGLLFKTLTLIGRNNWEEATDTLKIYSENFPGPHVYKVLMRLYEKLGKNELRKIFEKKHQEATTSPLSLHPLHS